MDQENDKKINKQIDELDQKKERKLRQLDNNTNSGSPKEMAESKSNETSL